MSWNAKMVLEMAGIQPAEADDWLVDLAEDCAERCYYLDRAAEEFMRVVRVSRC